MKTIKFVIVAAALAMAATSYAQNANEYLVVDTSAMAVPHKALLDSSLFGVDILESLSSDSRYGSVTVNQSRSVREALYNQIQNNGSRKIQGYRIRIYFDNSKNARYQSERIAQGFAANFPGQRVYRSHVSPYFKVTVGDFRTKTEAQIFAQSISGMYPSVFLVKEAINYPDN